MYLVLTKSAIPKTRLIVRNACIIFLTIFQALSRFRMYYARIPWAMCYFPEAGFCTYGGNGYLALDFEWRMTKF